MSNYYLPDGRVPKTGAIQLGDNKYTITRCVAGGNSLCYFVTNENGTHYVIKEFYPSRCAYRKASTGKICAIPGYEMVYDELKKRFRNENEYVNTVRDKTYQVGAYFENFYSEEGFALMRPYANDLHPLSALIQEFCDKKWGPMDRLGAAIEIMISLLSALKKLHEEIHIIHFDLSTSNVLYSQQYHVSLMDFGSARECRNGVVNIGQKLHIPGSTQEFGAPELAFSKHLTTAADIYSVGIIFYHLITSGIGCYSDNVIPSAEVLSRGGNLEMQYGIESLDILPGVKPILLDILYSATCSNPSMRFSCNEMIKGLTKLKEIVANKGIHREVLLQSSLEKYEAVEAAGFGQYIPALFPEMDMNISGHVLITGDGGSGKSTFFKRLWKKYADNMLRDSSNPIPLYIELQRFNGESKKDFILRSILNTYAKYYADVDNPIQRLKNLFNEGPYLLLLDGMNETTNPQGLMLEIGELAENANLTICIATREKPEWDQFEEFIETEIPNLSEDVIQDQLHHSGYTPAEGRLLQTLQRPMMLALYLGLGSQKQVQTPGEILLAHHNRLIANFRRIRHEQKYTDLRYFVLDKVFPLFAEKMDSLHFCEDKVIVCLSECAKIAEKNNSDIAKKVIRNWCAFVEKEEGIYVKTFDIDAMLEELQQTGLLRKADNGYAYAHQMYQEFYSALAIKQQMEDKSQDPLTTQLGQIPIHQSILTILGDLVGEYKYITKKDLISEPSKIEDWLQRNMRRKTGPAAQVVVRNLVECMKCSRNNFITAKYDGLDLSLVRFYGCSLPKASFNNAIVPEFAFISDGHKERIDSMAFAPKKGLLFTCENDDFFCWDVKTGLLRYKHEAKGNRAYTAIDVSLNEQYVIFHGYTSLVVRNVDDGTLVSSYQLPKYYEDTSSETLQLLDVLTEDSYFRLVSFLADSEEILLASSEGVLWKISAKTGKQVSPHMLLDIPDDVPDGSNRIDYFTWNLEKLVLSHKREKLAAVYFDRPIEMYDSDKLSKNIPISAVLKESGRADVAFSIDDKYLIVYADIRFDYVNELAVYSLMDDECTLLNPKCPCYEYSQGVTITGADNCVVVHPELPEEGPTFVWNFETNIKKEIINVPDLFKLFSGTNMDSNYLFYADDKFCVTFWDAETLCEKGHIYVGFKKPQSTDSSSNNYCGILGKKMWRLTWAGHFQMLSPDAQESTLCYAPETEIKSLKCNDACIYWQDGNSLIVIFTDKENGIITKRITIDGDVIYLSPKTNQVLLDCAQVIKAIGLHEKQKEHTFYVEDKWIQRIEWSQRNNHMLSINDTEIDPREQGLSPQEVKTISHMNSTELSTHLAKWCFLPELDRVVSYRSNIPRHSNCEGSLCVWNIKTGQKILHAQVLMSIAKFIRVLGTSYVIAVEKNKYHLWDIKECREIATWSVHPKAYLVSYYERTNNLLAELSQNDWYFSPKNIWDNFASRDIPDPEQIRDYFNQHVVFVDNQNTLTNMEMTVILLSQLENMIVRLSTDKQRISIRLKDGVSFEIVDVSGESNEIKTIFHEQGNITDFCLDEHGKHLIVYGDDASVYCYDIDADIVHVSEYEWHNPVEFIWPSIDARDIDRCDFRNAHFCNDREEIRNTLRLNGAILD